MTSNQQNLFLSSSPTGATGTVDNMSPVQGDEHMHREPHTITDGLQTDADPSGNQAFTFHRNTQLGDGAGGSSAPPVSPDVWFFQEQERLKNEYMRRIAEQKQMATRTLSFDSTEPSSQLRAPNSSKRPVRQSALKNRAGAPPRGTGHLPE